jgi:peptidyl-prolyl cis-trans isomerase B (cyclophilin B)
MVPPAAKPSIRWLCLFLLLLTHPLRAAVREIATISTSLGTMEFELFSDVSHRAVANFKYLADTKFYDNTAFHRHIQGFMVQGGDPQTRGTTSGGYTPDFGLYGQRGPEYTIPNERTQREDRAHVRGVISMAKTNAPDSAGSQFFVMFGNYRGLDRGLDDVYAPMGSLISGESVLQAIEALPKNQVPPRVDANERPLLGENGLPLDPPLDLPLSPILVHSVSVRSERTENTPASRMLFQPGTLGGLLRRIDRNQDVCGSYQLTVTRGGAFSAQIQYYGRRNSFTGVMLQGDPSIPEADYAGKLDPTAVAPLRVRLHARQTAASSVSIVLRVGGLNPDGSDLLDSTLSVAAGEVGGQSSLAERYTAAFEAPLVATDSSTVAPLYSDMKGIGYLAANVRPLTGLALVTGRLQDNRSFTLARPVSNEGGRFLLPLFFHELQDSRESQRALFPSYPLADWSFKYFRFSEFRFRLVAALELPPKPSLPQPANVSGSYVIWYREKKTAGPVLSEIASYLPVVAAAWTPPRAGQTLSPFASSSTAQLLSGGSLAGGFRVAKSNVSAVFTLPNSAAPQLRFNPVDGTFQGGFVDTSLSAKPRRTFQGVLLQKNGINKGVGFLLTEGASLPVVLSP